MVNSSIEKLSAFSLFAIEIPPFTTFFFFVLFAEGLGCSELGSMEADPDDCGSFLICNHNEYQKMACRDGTHYDPQVKVCNHPDQVKCEVGGNSVKPIRIRLEK